MIDVFTWIAQIINFIVLMLLLRHFLYGRIVNAIDTRQERLEGKWEEADRKRHEAEQKAEEYEKKNNEIDNERESILSKSRKQADERRKQLVAEAREDVRKMKVRWRQQLDREKQAFLRNLQLEMGRQATEVARHILGDMADADLESCIVDNFIERIKQSDEEKAKLRDILQKREESIRILSSFDMKDVNRGRLEDFLEELREQPIKVRYEQSSDLICGLRVVSNGRHVLWSVSQYIEGLHEQFDKYFTENEPETEQTGKKSSDEKERQTKE